MKYTAKELRLSDKLANLALIRNRRIELCKRPKQEYIEILIERASGLSYKEIGKRHGNVSATMGLVLVFSAFCFQETGQL